MPPPGVLAADPMKQTIGDAERSMWDLGYLFMAEQQHISCMFVERHKTFLARLLPQAHKQFGVSLQSISGWPAVKRT
jgi:hypothetical protein